MTDPNASDGWPPFGSQLASVPFVHAFGQTSLAYNLLEDMMGMIFTSSMPTKTAFSEGLFQKLNNRDRMNFLKAVIDHNEKHEPAKSAFLYLITCFDICTENRNILMHVIVEVTCH